MEQIKNARLGDAFFWLSNGKVIQLPFPKDTSDPREHPENLWELRKIGHQADRHELNAWYEQYRAQEEIYGRDMDSETKRLIHDGIDALSNLDKIPYSQTDHDFFWYKR